MSLKFQQQYIPLDIQSARYAPLLLFAHNCRFALWRRIAIDVNEKGTWKDSPDGGGG